MKAKLQKLLEDNQGTITEAVINEALNYGYDEPKQFFEDVLHY